MIDNYEVEENVQMFLFWPRATVFKNKMELATNILEQRSKILSSRTISLSYNGYRNLLIQVYADCSWAGTIENHFKGIIGKVNEIYDKEGVLVAYKIKLAPGENVTSIKEDIRSLFAIEKSSCHSSDSYEESKIMEQLLFNDNSIHALNYGRVDFDKDTFDNILKFRNKLCEKGMDEVEHYVVDSSAVLAIYGLRKARDIDYLTNHDDLMVEYADNHLGQLKFHVYSVEELLNDSQLYFWSLGVKFVAIAPLIAFKENRGEKKDLEDVGLLRAIGEDSIKKNVMQGLIRLRMAFAKKKEAVRGELEGNNLVFLVKIWHFLNGKGYK